MSTLEVHAKKQVHNSQLNALNRLRGHVYLDKALNYERFFISTVQLLLSHIMFHNGSLKVH